MALVFVREESEGWKRMKNCANSLILDPPAALPHLRHVPDLYWLQPHLGDAPRSVGDQVESFDLLFITAM